MSKKKLMCGNEALAEAAIQAGLDAYFGYPITPQNEIPAYMARHMPARGRVFVQSESELAAINMVLGAAATGARVMTSSSSPGISLMQEGISYMAGCELPAVLVNIVRGGPGLGSIGPSQADYFQSTRGGGHGDYRTIVLTPDSVQEMADFMFLAFDLADAYRNPVLIQADGVLGQMMEPVSIEPKPSRPLPPKDWALTGAQDRPQNVVRSLYIGELEQTNNILRDKYEQIMREEVLCEQVNVEDAEIILVAYGISARICRAAMTDARLQGIKVGLLRPQTVWPFPTQQIRRLAEKGSCRFVAVEISQGQMVEDVRLAVEGRVPVDFYGRSGDVVPEMSELMELIKRLSLAKEAKK